MKDCNCRIIDNKEMVMDIESKKVVMRGKPKGNTPLGKYENEYMRILPMTGDDKIIEDIIEFCGSAKAIELLKKQQAQMNAWS